MYVLTVLRPPLPAVTVIVLRNGQFYILKEVSVAKFERHGTAGRNASRGFCFTQNKQQEQKHHYIVIGACPNFIDLFPKSQI